MTDDEFFKSIGTLVHHASVRRQEALTAADVGKFTEWDSLFRGFQTIEQRRETAGHLATRPIQEVGTRSTEIVMSDDEFFRAVETLREHTSLRRQESLTAADIKAFRWWNYLFSDFDRLLALRESSQLLKKMMEDDPPKR